MTSMREASRKAWTSDDRIEHINGGSLQRIADATERMAAPYLEMLHDRDRLAKLVMERNEDIKRLERRLSAAKGLVTRLNNRIKKMQERS